MHSKGWRLFIALGLAILLASYVIRCASALDHQLEILGGPITVTQESKSGPMTTIITIVNRGPEIPVFTVRATSDEKQPISVMVSDTITSIPAYSAVQINLQFHGATTQKIMGYLIIESSENEPAIERLIMIPFLDASENAFPGISRMNTSFILMWSFLIGFILLLFGSLLSIGYKFRAKRKKYSQVFRMRMTGLQWDYKENWASTFVAVGGILTNIVGSDIMPEIPIIISKQGFYLLNILFPILIVVAPFLLTALNSLVKEPKTDKGIRITDDVGKVPLLILPYVIGSVTVTWAVLGELFTLAVLFQELYLANHLTLVVTWTAQMLTIIIAILGIYYSWKKIVQTSLSAKTIDEMKMETSPSGIIKASRDSGKAEIHKVYLP